jgi:hypothetical protein
MYKRRTTKEHAQYDRPINHDESVSTTLSQSNIRAARNALCRVLPPASGATRRTAGAADDNVFATTANHIQFCLCTEVISVILRAVSVDKILFVGLLQTLNGDGLKPRLPRRNQAVHTQGGRTMVAHASNSHANGKSQTHSAFQMYFGGLEAFGQAYNPFLKGLAQTQLEMLGFFNRRAQAYMQIPTRAAQCRTPQDVANAQTQFWRAAYEDYTESVGRVTNALSACVLPNLAALVSDEVRNAHDYIAFPDSKEQSGSARARERKAA